MPRKQTKKRSVKARSPIMTRSRTRKAAEEAKAKADAKAKAKSKPRRGGLAVITTNRFGSKGQIGKVADYSRDGKRVGLITLYNGHFNVINVIDVRTLTEAERKKKPKMNPSYKRDTNLSAVERDLLNNERLG